MAPSRGLQYILGRLNVPVTCQRCQSRSFVTTVRSQSGHNRWSKIKHDKAKVDAGKNRQRSIFAQEIATASRLFGGDPNMNPRLADLVTKAKREGFAKASIEGAIARGQGRSLSGASLESVSVEGILPNNVAVIVECETDNKLRTLAEVRLIMKEHGGSTTPTSYLFAKKGKIILENKEGLNSDEALEAALEAGAIDVAEDEDGRVVIWTEPAETRAVGDAISTALDVQIATSEIIWDPNEETKVGVSSEDAAEELASFVDKMNDREATVQSISLNVSQGSLSPHAWKDLQSHLNS